MKKKLLFVLIFLCAAFWIFAYNPPAGGENMYSYTSPFMMTGGNSAVGGAFFAEVAETITVNPALTAGAQRINIGLAGTFLSGLGANPEGSGGAFYSGLVFPTKWGVATGVLQGVFSDFDVMPLGKTVVIRAGFSKDITNNFYVGAAVDGGFGSSWTINASLGMLHKVGDFGFLSNIRWGASITGMGKPFTANTVGLNNAQSDFYPSFFTPHVGIGVTLLNKKEFSIGTAIDISAPAFQNGVFDVSFAFKILDLITLSTNWTANIRELAAGKSALIPSAGLSAKFTVTGGKNSFLEKQGWAKSDITPSTSYKRTYGGLNAISAGASIWLGSRDTESPIIILGE